MLKSLKTMVAALGCVLAASAQAHWVPSGGTSSYTATVSTGSGAFSYTDVDNTFTPKPLPRLAGALASVNTRLESALNERLKAAAVAQGLNYQGGTVSGDLSITIQPVAGAMQATLSGLSFRGTTQYSGRKFGVITFDCINTATISNITIRAQYGANTGVVSAPTVGMTGQVGSSTECDSNLSWILPFVGDLLIDYAANKIDDRILAGAVQLMADSQGSLLYGQDANLGQTVVGLLTLIPENANIAGFAVGSYVRSNLPYLLANSQFTMKLGHWPKIDPWRRNVPPASDLVYTSELLNMSLTAPGASFNVRLTNSMTDVEWVWVCNVDNLALQCPQP